MIKFTALVIALVLAPGLHSAVVSRNLITTYPLLIIDHAIPETRPLPLPVVIPELEEVIPEVVPETKPIPVEANPCEACFSYMATLIDQLTETVEPQLPEFLPESPVEVEILPQPSEPILPVIPPAILPQPIIPSSPVVVRPLPILTEAQSEAELAKQDRPLPEYIIR